MKHGVSEAFESLIGEIQRVESYFNTKANDARKRQYYGAARHAQEIVKKIAKFKERIRRCKQRWVSMMAKWQRYAARRRPTHKGRLRPGLRTPERQFRKPILEALVELGGKAPGSKVLDRVGEKMKDVLTPYDYNPLPSNPGSVRWRNTAQWCRFTLVREGLMKSDSPKGIWEISDLGREALQNENLFS